MYIIIDDRKVVTQSYASGFGREGVAVLGLEAPAFQDWISALPTHDLHAIEAVLLGGCEARETFARAIRSRCPAPIIALSDQPDLEQTLSLYAAGVDDVARKPIHVREILARVGAIQRRSEAQAVETLLRLGELCVFFDGRDPEIAGDPLPLPRRERRILECLARHQGRRVSREQIFSFVYGMCNDGVEERVIESHLSRLRKKLRLRLGYDPIDSKRHMGYALTLGAPARTGPAH
jgi:DNA-binding response OmpR family regulator